MRQMAGRIRRLEVEAESRRNQGCGGGVLVCRQKAGESFREAVDRVYREHAAEVGICTGGHLVVPGMAESEEEWLEQVRSLFW